MWLSLVSREDFKCLNHMLFESQGKHGHLRGYSMPSFDREGFEKLNYFLNTLSKFITDSDSGDTQFLVREVTLQS